MNNRSSVSRLVWLKLAPLALAMAAFSLGLYYLAGDSGGTSQAKVLRVLSYSTFVNEWGPGPEVARLFEAEYGLKVEYHDAGDAGLILNKMDLVPADVVIGFDQLILEQARAKRKWREIFSDASAASGAEVKREWLQPDFLPFDWAPMTFIYRDGTAAPASLIDLLDPRFTKSIALQDPRTSTPGLQFLYWVLDEFGVEEGFDFLSRLKPNIHSVSGSWSTAYGLFTSGNAKLAFSYLTSPVYHWVEEKNEAYRPAIFPSGHPVQVEYAGVPESCLDCVGGRLFALFLLKPEVQKVIMAKNYMLPITDSVRAGSKFAELPKVDVREMKSLPDLVKNRDALLERWRELGL